MAITDNLISYWELEETSGTRNDATATANNLTDNNTVTSNPGKVGTAAQFTAANSEYLSMANNSSFNAIHGHVSFTVVAWAYLDTKPTGNYPVVLAQSNQGSGGDCFILYYYQVPDRFIAGISADGSARTEVNANTFGSPSTSTWYFLIWQYDATNNLLKISVNNGSFDTTSQSSGTFASTADFCIGVYANGVDTAGFMNGRVDQVGIWSRLLNSTELSFLYNSGNGRSYADLVFDPATLAATYAEINSGGFVGRAWV